MPTVDALFDSARTALEYGHVVRICYDRRFGHPVSFSTNVAGQDPEGVFTIKLAKLQPLDAVR